MNDPAVYGIGLSTAGDLEGCPGGAVLPVGSFEPHGAHLPLATDTLIAVAFARLLAERCRCVVFPPQFYTPAETTRLLRPTVSICGEVFIPYLTNVCREILRHGFSPLLLLSIHHGNDPALTIVVQELFRETNGPVAHLDPLALGINTCAKSIAPEADGDTWETSVLFGALEILGLSETCASSSPAEETRTASPSDISKAAKAFSFVGHVYTDLAEHIPMRTPLPGEKVRQFMESVTDIMADAYRELEQAAAQTGSARNHRTNG
jgi:creatinine amidohydrolase/Fe(II)-dependent formamide hydrolase-like protein